jgi:ABC-type sugar transport system permease subunit
MGAAVAFVLMAIIVVLVFVVGRLAQERPEEAAA